MSYEKSENRSAEAQLALAHTPIEFRAALSIVFELDARLARIVAGTSEPMLGQMRLAWWRDILKEPVEKRPRGDTVLDAIGQHWQEREAPLIAMVDGWEYMLADELDHKTASAFAQGRGAPLVSIATETSNEADIHARRWALVDAAVHLPEGDERELLLDLARSLPRGERLPRTFRGVAVLSALAGRSLERGGRPLMEGRGAALVAARAAIFGR